MEKKDKLIIIKCINIVITPMLIKGKSGVEINRMFQNKYIGEDLSFIEARKGLRMKVRKFINEIHLLSDSSKNYMIILLQDLEETIENEKSKLYCQELIYLISNEDYPNIFTTPNITALVKTEIIFSIISFILVVVLLYFSYNYLIK